MGIFHPLQDHSMGSLIETKDAGVYERIQQLKCRHLYSLGRWLVFLERDKEQLHDFGDYVIFNGDLLK
jgi:hypothetical protein